MLASGNTQLSLQCGSSTRSGFSAGNRVFGCGLRQPEAAPAIPSREVVVAGFRTRGERSRVVPPAKGPMRKAGTAQFAAAAPSLQVRNMKLWNSIHQTETI